jgi:hypothetical protein
VFLHSAAFEFNGCCYLLAGRKGAGKTSTLLSLMAFSDKVKIISNDRVCLNEGVIFGLDKDIRLTKETQGELVRCYGEQNALNSCIREKTVVKPQYTKGLLSFDSLTEYGYNVCPGAVLKSIIECDFRPEEGAAIQFADKGRALIADYLDDDADEHPDWAKIGIQTRPDVIKNITYPVTVFTFSRNMSLAADELIKHIMHESFD